MLLPFQWHYISRSSVWTLGTGFYHRTQIPHCCRCSVPQSCPTLCDPMDCSTPGFPVLHSLLEFIQTHAHPAGDTIPPSHPLSSPSPPAFYLSQHQDLSQWVSCYNNLIICSFLMLSSGPGHGCTRAHLTNRHWRTSELFLVFHYYK